MLDSKKITQAEQNVTSYLQDGLMKKIEYNQDILHTYITNSQESLRVADLISENKASNLWVIVVSYYSMYYISNAVLYKLGYKIGDKISHKITSDSLIVFVRDKLLQSLLESFEEIKEEALELVSNKTDQLIMNFEQERAKRGKFQYQMNEEIKVAKATTSLQRAKEFVNEMKDVLDSLQERR